MKRARGPATNVVGLAVVLLAFVVFAPNAAADTEYDAAVAAATAVDATLDPGPLQVGRTMAIGAGQSTFFGVNGPAKFAFAAQVDPLTGNASGHMVLEFKGSPATTADVTCMTAVASPGGGGTAILTGRRTNGPGMLSFTITDSGSSTTPDMWGPTGSSDCTTPSFEAPIDQGVIFIRFATP